MDEQFKMIVLSSDYFHKWRTFVSNHPKGSIFQTPEFGDVCSKTKYMDAVCLAAIDESNQILSLMQIIFIKELDGLLSSFSSRAIIQGGPLFVENEKGYLATSFLLNEYKRNYKNKALFSEIRNVCDMGQYIPLLNNAGFSYDDHLNFIINLNMTEDELFYKINRSMRKNITRAQKKGISIEEVDDVEKIKIFYSFLIDVYSKAKVPVEDLTHFEAIYNVLVKNNMASFHLANYEGNYVGGRVTLFYNDTIYAYSVGVPREYKKLNVNALLNWHIMKWGVDKGYSFFDFGGAGNPNKDYGVRDFKSQFGGDLVNYGRLKLVHSNLKMKVSEIGFEVYKRIFI